MNNPLYPILEEVLLGEPKRESDSWLPAYRVMRRFGAGKNGPYAWTLEHSTFSIVEARRVARFVAKQENTEVCIMVESP